MIGLYIVVIVLGFISARVHMISARGVVLDRNIVIDLISLLSIFGNISLLIWGFIYLAWYWPIVAFVIATAISGLIVTRNNWLRFYLIRWLIDMMVVVGVFYFWFRLPS